MTIQDQREEEKKILNQIVAASEEKYRKLFIEMIDGFALHELIFDHEGNAIDYVTLEVNKSFELLLNTTAALTVNRKVSEILPQKELKYWLGIFAPVALTGKSASYEMYSPLNDKYFEGIAYCPEKGKFAVTFRDVTERKKAQEELLRSNENLAFAQKSAKAGIWDWDINTGKLNWSPELYILFGLDPVKDTASFDTWRMVLHPDDRQGAEEKINASIKEKKLLSNEYRIILPTGEILWINALGSTLYDDCGNALRMSGICIDITELKKTQDTLRISEEKFSKAFHSSPQGISITSLDDSKIIEVNSAFTDILGYSREEAIGRSAAKLGVFIYPEAREKYIEILRKEGFIRNMELEFRNKNGSIITLLFSMDLIDLEGRACILSTFYDITDRNLAEKALRESAELFRTILSTAMSGFCLIDMQGRLLQINDTYCKMSGYDMQELLVMNISDMEAIEKTSDTAAHIQKVIEHGEDRFESRHRRKDGTVYDIEISVQYFVTMDGGRLVTFMQDITERKKAEKLLQESEEKYRSLVERANDGVAVVGDGLISLSNTRLEEMLGYKSGELNGLPLSKFLVPEKLEFEMKRFKNKIDGMELPPVYETEIFDKSGNRKPVEISGVVIQYEGKPGELVIVRDIVERKKSEAKIIYLSFHDSLTGLYNRRFFEEELKRLDTERQLPLSFIMGDLNGLKIINDVFGHSEGDNLLKETSEILKKVCRLDDILSRWGGDEFVILLPKTTSADSEEILKRIKNECKKTKIQKIPISLSIGSATKEKPGHSIQAIVIEAESNMYKNKLAQKESLTSSIVFALDRTLYEKSNETKEHTDRIGVLAIKLGKSINLPYHLIDELSLLASLHDIGKVAIPERILLKKGKLTEKDWYIIKRHPEIGFNIAQSSPQIAHIAKPILSCHENWDGSGYPLGLKGESIPVISRIILIVDAYDVMTNGRSYKPAMGKEDAAEELKRCAGTQFDPVLVEKFIEILAK